MLFLIALAFGIFGAVVKITYAPNAYLVLIFSSFLMIISVIIMIINLITTKDKKSFLHQ